MRNFHAFGSNAPDRSGPAADRNFKGPSYNTFDYVRYRLKMDTGVLKRGLGSVGDNGNDFVGLEEPSPGTALWRPVPEPGSGLLSGFALGALAWWRQRKLSLGST